VISERSANFRSARSRARGERRDVIARHVDRRLEIDARHRFDRGVRDRLLKRRDERGGLHLGEA
jgi:hypothetical protein